MPNIYPKSCVNYRELIDWAKEHEKSVTIVCTDCQVDFVYGALPNEAAQIAVPKINELLQYAKASGVKVRFVFTHDTHYDKEALQKAKLDGKKHILYSDSQEGRKLPIPHCIYDTYGWQIVPEIDIESLGDVIYIDKETFGYTDWKKVGGDDIMIFVGFCTDICVVSNVLICKAEFPDAEIFVVVECCAGLTPEKHNAALEVMRSCQVTVI